MTTEVTTVMATEVTTEMATAVTTEVATEKYTEVYTEYTVMAASGWKQYTSRQARHSQNNIDRVN